MDPEVLQLLLLVSTVVSESQIAAKPDAAAIRQLVYSIKKRMNVK